VRTAQGPGPDGPFAAGAAGCRYLRGFLSGMARGAEEEARKPGKEMRGLRVSWIAGR